MKSFAVILSAFAFAFFLIPSAKAATPIACPENYAPVCGAQQVQCVRAPCYPVYKTYSNACFLNGDKAAFIHEDECTASETGPYKGGDGGSSSSDGSSGGIYVPYVPPEGCMAWFDGCNSCSRTTKNGPAMCTMMACANDNHQPGYCRSYGTPEPPVDTGIGENPNPPEEAVVNPTNPPPLGNDARYADNFGDNGFARFFSYAWSSITDWFSSIFD